MVYTSYFGNYKNFPEDSYVIGVAQWPPPDVENWAELAPAAELLRQFKNKEIDEFIFAVKYQIYLEDNIDKVIYQEKLRELEKNYQNIILCCYEAKNDFCHRHILADWLDLKIKEI